MHHSNLFIALFDLNSQHFTVSFFKIHKVKCKLNWLFSSFTYLPNFIIWLPSFSSPWLVQLASKCHLAICAFVRFLDFFHSVKKVSKPSIFCEIICVSKRTLVILIRMLYCKAFFKAKNFVILLFLSFVWFISGEGISLGIIFPGGNFSRGQFSRGQSSGGNFHRGERSYGEGFFSWGGIFLGGNFLGGNFLGDNFPYTVNGDIFVLILIYFCS